MLTQTILAHHAMTVNNIVAKTALEFLGKMLYTSLNPILIGCNKIWSLEQLTVFWDKRAYNNVVF